MKKFFSLTLAFLMLFPTIFSVGCAKKDDVIYLDVYNWEDYLCIDEDVNLIEAFEEMASEKYQKTVKVNYSTFGTNENMYNELQLSKVKREDGSYDYGYDLVCPSDYMIQKMILEGMVEKYDRTLNNLTNYDTYSSNYILNLFETNGWTDYACAYMYGTMGFVYNPDVLAQNGYQDGDELKWDLPWKTYYKNLGTIKDSIRDTYALAIGYVYSSELLTLKESYNSGNYTESEYSKEVEKIFNLTDPETVQKVTDALTVLKGNVYGFEVDSGKRDMASGKIAINFAWSGDAVYTLDIAEEAGTELYYTVPEEGSNIWFDGWVMPKGANVELAQDFVNFLADPENAKSNMNFIGYTPAVAGEEMVELCKEWYGVYTLIETTDVDNADFIDDDGTAYFEYYIQDAIDEGLLVEGINYTLNGIDSETGYKKITVSEIKYPEYDDDENIIGFTSEENVELFDYDVSFLLTTREDNLNGVTYSVWTDTLGRQLTTQYPDRETVMRCAIMKHFSDEEMKRLNDMWDEVKVMAMPTWLMWFIVISILVVAVVYPIMAELNKRGVRINIKRKNPNLRLIKREILK
ncbi:MAG: extracellular solute-binding protein [Clostridia bacterium]|nr:extracellular solute-binding protein [Clostridia bacterium]